jgi:hypothetical protein
MPGFVPGIHAFFLTRPNRPNGIANFGFSEFSLDAGVKSAL